MDSDSDSASSHISATPPRHSPPPPPPATQSIPPPAPPQPPPPAPAPPVSTKLKTKATTTTTAKSYSRPILLPKLYTKKKKKPPSNPTPQPPPPPQNPLPKIPVSDPPIATDLPFKIRRITSFQTPNASLSSFASFSQGKGKDLNFQCIDSDPVPQNGQESGNQSFPDVFCSDNGVRVAPGFSSLVGSGKNLNFECVDSERVAENAREFGNESDKGVRGLSSLVGSGKNFNVESIDGNSVGSGAQEHGHGSFGYSGNLEKGVRVASRLPNLIGSGSLNSKGNVGSSSVGLKKPKCVNEGNFVRLNINGYGKKKFGKKFKGNGYNSNSWNGNKRFYRKGKRKFKGEGEVSESLDPEGLVVNLKGEKGSEGYDVEMIENAVKRVRDEVSDENLLNLLKAAFGYDSFREGQLEAIKMVLSGKSTMLVLPTGAGKSLCYQLPALVLTGLTLVVSPLIALMIDQLKKLCPAISGAFLSSSQTFEEAAETLRLLQEGEIKVLFVSPERLLNGEFVSIFSNGRLISLVVVDEAHCVSEWSHNFRPSYMRIRASLLRTRLNAECILAMTATATTKTLHDVMHALEIPPSHLIQSAQVRDNLYLSVSISKNRMKDLITLVKSSPFSEAKSIIIYCKFQSETDTISKYLCDNNIPAKSYHSAIPSKDRSRIQECFCSNKLRVVVATVAFGMGLDKSDVGAVIHYSLPESLEEYVQEIGRAGRDGRLSYCHLFFDDVTYIKLRSLMYSDGVDEYAVNKFLSQVFDSGLNSAKVCSVIKESASRKFDMKEEVMLTILTQLELGGMKYLQLLPQMNVTCTVNFHQTSPALLAAKDIMVAAILTKAEKKDGQYVFDIPSLANSVRVQPVDISNHLLNLKFKGEITYDLKDQAFCYIIVDIPKDICSLATQLTKWLSEVEFCKVKKLDAMYNAAIFAVKECNKLNGCRDNQHTYCLQKNIVEYFSETADRDITNYKSQNSPFLRADIKVFLQSNAQAKFTPRAIARVMHGLTSPSFPSATWSRTHFWGRYMQTDFKLVMEAAKAELINFTRKDA